MPIGMRNTNYVRMTDSGSKGTAQAPNIPDPYGGEGVVTSQTPATYQPPKTTTTTKPATTITPPPNVPDPYGGEGVVTSPTPATYQYVPRAAVPTTAPNRVATLTDGSVDPYGVQQSGETGRVQEIVATLPAPPINTPLGYPADAYQRAAAIEAERAATGTATPTQSTQPSYPNINEIDPRTGMPEGSSADYWATQKEVNAPAYGMDIYSDIQRRTEYQNILARGGGYTDPNAPALDPYGVNADAARRDEATAQVPTTKATTTPISTDGSQQGGGTYYSTSGGGTATQQTGGIPTGTGETTPTGETAQAASGNALFKQALEMQFEWKPEEDPNYQIAVKQAEQAVVNMMVSRGGLYSSVTNSAFQSKLIELQGIFYNQAYDNFKADRAFIVDMAKIAYGREDEAWNRNMEMLKYQSAREDEMFSRSMQQRNAALNESKFAYQKQRDQAQLEYQQNVSSLSFRSKSYDDVNKQYESMMNKWRSNGYATADIAEFFGVAVGTPITSRTGSEAATTVANALTQEYNAITQTAASLGKDAKFFEDLFDLEQSYSISDVTGKDVTNLGTSQQANKYYSALNHYVNLIDAEAEKQESAAAGKAEARKQMQVIIDNAAAIIADMGENYFRRLVAEIDART